MKIIPIHIFSVLMLLISFGPLNGTAQSNFFSEATPIWPNQLENEQNITIGFYTSFKKPATGEVVLAITGSSIYRIYLNGKFVGHGPARAGHDYYRVDDWSLTPYLQAGINHLAIEVASYHVNSYYLLDQPAFLQAEVTTGESVLCATSTKKTDFVAYRLLERIQKVPRYSFQRPFIEYYRLDPSFDQWRTHPEPDLKKLVYSQVSTKNLIPRRISYPTFTIRQPIAEEANGKIYTNIKREKYWKDRSLINIGEQLQGFKENDLVYNPAIELQEMESNEIIIHYETFSTLEKYHLDNNQFRTFDMGTNLSGFIGIELEVSQAGRFFITFDEILTDGDVDFKRMDCINAITYELEPGKYSLESIEPYTFRHLKIIATNGAAVIHDVYLRELTNPDVNKASFQSSDHRLNRIFESGVETFRQNALDLFMDCPSRERAGWLCDSYFAARVAQDVSGHALIEKNFFENFLLPDSFDHLPEGMLPMCYPADHNDGVFIPNWAMWFVIQLPEYLSRTNDRALVDALKPKVLKLLKYFEPFENESGLLEKLDSWIFIEWSEANRFVQDVNYPTNMLYAATLQKVGELYQEKKLIQKAEHIRDSIRSQSFNGTFFVDNAIRDKNGQLQPTNNITEVCQYYAFYFNVANIDSHPALWQKLSKDFGPQRKDNNLYPNVYFANSFIGNYLRLELLSQYQLQSQLLKESIDYFDYMAKRTGTLWENQSAHASCNHGFAAHIVHVLYRDVLCIRSIDYQKKLITIQFSNVNLNYCKGQLPIGHDLISLQWKCHKDTLLYQLDVPENFTANILNNTKLKLKKVDYLDISNK